MASFRERVVRGFGWVMSFTVAGRLVQLGALAITTRLLDPADFGIFAVVTAAGLFVERVTSFGLEGALIQRRTVTDPMLNVAWSYQFARNLVLGILVFACAPLLASAFRQPDAAPFLQLAALSFPIAGLRNVGLVKLRKELRFRELGICDLTPLLTQAAVSVILTAWLRNVWALVIATLVAHIAAVVVSYYYAAHRPAINFTWSVARPLFAFGAFLFGNTLLQMFREQGVVFILARMVSLDDMGYYNRATAFSLVLLIQAQGIFWRVAFPAMSALQGPAERLRRAWSKATMLMTLAATIGAILFIPLVPLAVPILLGEQWAPIATLVQIFGLFGILLMAGAPSEVLFQAAGRPAVGTVIQAIGTVCLFAVVVPLVDRTGFTGVGWAFVASGLITLPLTIFLARRLANQEPRFQT